MPDKLNLVKNPLTIIGLFAGLAQACSTAVMPLLASDVQRIYVWFLMGFPIFLVICFFVTLNFNPNVLYAPSDYREDESYIKMNLLRHVRILTPAELQNKGEREADEYVSAEASLKTTSKDSPFESAARSSFITGYAEVEQLVGRLLRREYGKDLVSNVVVPLDGNSVELDAIISAAPDLVVVEIKYFRAGILPSGLINQLHMLTHRAARLAEKYGYSVGRVLLVAVVDSQRVDKANFENELRQKIRSKDFSIRCYTVDELRASIA